MTWGDADIDEESKVPLWFQIAQHLRSAIESGEFTTGDLLPSEAALNDRFGVSRTTSRAALNSLEQQGYVRRRSGKGSVVLPTQVEQPLRAISGFGTDMRERGLIPSYDTREIRVVGATPEAAASLNIDAGGQVLRIRRVLKANGSPIATSVSHITMTHLQTSGIPTHDDLNSGSLYEWLDKRAGIRLVRGRETIEAALVSEIDANLLEIPAGAPALVIKRISCDELSTPTEYVVMKYSAARYRVQIELPG